MNQERHISAQDDALLNGATQGHVADFKKIFYWLLGINTLITVMEGINLGWSPSPAILAGFTHDVVLGLAMLWAHFKMRAGHVRVALEIFFWGLLLGNVAGIFQPVSYVAVGLVSVVCVLVVAPFLDAKTLARRIWIAWGSTVLCLAGNAWVHEEMLMSPLGFSIYRGVLLSMASGVTLLIIFKSRERLNEAAEARDKAEHRFLQVQRLDAIGKLAGGVAHDFNNLLAIIQLNAEAARDAKNSEDSRSMLDSVLSATNRGAALTRQLMAFSKAQKFKAQVVDLNQIIHDTTRMLGRLIGEDIQLTQLRSRLPAKVLADADQMSQVLINLAVNARDAMPRGGSLSIETSHISFGRGDLADGSEIPAGDFVLLSVSDTGAGMDESTLARIFEPFFSTKEKSKGTGLGLAVVYSIISAAGGFIRVYSQLGQGSTFKIYLPRHDGDTDEASEARPDKSSGHGEKILLVEDESDLRRIVAVALRQHGYEVFEAAEAAEAKRIMTEQKLNIDLLFSDIIMPGQRGDELALDLLVMKPSLRLLFSSGYTEHSLQADPSLSHAEYLAKPYSLDSMLETVRRALNHTKP